METLVIKTVINQTIMSQAWKETSLKVQRIASKTKGVITHVNNLATSALNPSKNRVMIYAKLYGNIQSRDKKPGRYIEKYSLKSNRIVTPTVFASMQNQVMRWGIPVHMAIISFDIWPDIIADTEFSTWFNKTALAA
jgi:hypothetical protein